MLSSNCVPMALLRRPLAQAMLGALLLAASVPGISLARAADADGVGIERARANYAIPSGLLVQVLPRFAAAAGVAVAFDPDELAGKRSNGISGVFTVDEGFAIVLRGAGVQAERRGNGYVIVAQPMSATSSENSGTALAAVTVTAAMPPYMADRPSSIATKIELTPRQTPFSVDQVTEELMRERGDTDIFQTLEAFAGLTLESSNSDAGQGHSRGVQVRGFSNGQTLINGIPSYSDNAGTVRGTDSLETVELLRGPAGIYYGSAEPGGVISYNYKRPKSKPAYVFRLDTDDKGSYGGMADLTGPIDDQGVFLYRLVGSYKHRKNDQEHIFSEPKSVMAALTVKPSADFNTTLTLERMDMESVPEQENNFKITSGPLAGQYYPVPKDFFWGSLNDRVVRVTDSAIWDATWSKSDALKIRAGLTYQEYEQWWQNTRVDAASSGPDANGNVRRYVSGRQSEGASYSGSLDVSGKLDLGRWRHEWLLGGGYGHSEGSSSGRAVASQSRSTGAYYVGSLNIYNPVYKDYAHQYLIWKDPLVPGAERTDKNLYLQDVITLPNGRTRIMLGAGWSEYLNETTTTSNKVDQWTPRLAVMHDLTDTTSIYASYGETFLPQASTGYLDKSGGYLTDPVEGVQYEIGVKQDLFGGRAMFTGALFQIERKNEAMQEEGFTCTPGQAAVVGDPGNASENCYSLAGLTRAQGAELRLSGEIREGWVAHLGYSYTESRVLDGVSNAQLGRTRPYMPRHAISLWNKFDIFSHETYGKFSLGLGLKAWSKSHGTWSGNEQSATTNWNPGYGLVDLGLFWNKRMAGKDVKLALNVSNLLDKAYYDRRRFPPSTVVYGDERRVSLSAQLAF